MRNFSDAEYVKMFRKLVFWEWYTDVNTTKLFLHCLLMANWQPGRWRGISYKKGQFFTSISNLSKETGLTVREVRTALDHLMSTNEVTSQTTSRYTLITVVNFEKYQGKRQTERQTNDTQNDTQNDKQPTNKRQQNKNNKNNKNEKEEYTAPPESEQNENYEDYEDDEEGFIIPQKDEHGNWINIPEEWKKVGGVVQIRC
jgi:DNA replication protein DnaD